MANLLDLLGIDSRRCSMTLVEYKYDPKERERLSKYLVRHSSSVSGTTPSNTLPLSETVMAHSNPLSHWTIFQAD